MDTRERARDCVGLAVAAVWLAVAVAPAAASVNYGPISHSGLKKVGPTSTGLKLGLQIGLDANNSGIQKAAKSASNPSSSSYGKYLSLSSLQSKYGATSSVRKGVVNAFKSQNVTATVDVTHLRVSATSIGKAQKMFGTKWADYKTSSGGIVALPVNTPKLPKGIKGNVNTVAGMRLTVKGQSSSASNPPRPRRVVGADAAAATDGGTPTRTGSVGPTASPRPIPACWSSPTACIRTRS